MNSITSSRFRVIFEGRGNYRVIDQDLKVFHAEITGRLRGAGERPAVGDWVSGQTQPGDWVLIEEIAERKSMLARRDPRGEGEQVLAANVDTLFIVTSANQDFNLNRIDRYVALALTGSVNPVIIINKIELADDPRSLLDAAAARFSDFDVHGTSVTEAWNLDCLDRYACPGATVAFVGSSGVGKSSLANTLLDGSRAETGAIRESDGRGRHTTTHRELHVARTGAMVIDTPGLRQVGLTEDADLSSSFADIEGLARACRFNDCRHGSEPGCAIQAALADGSLDADRWQSFLKLEREIAFERRKNDKALQSEQRKKWAKMHVAHRARDRSRRP